MTVVMTSRAILPQMIGRRTLLAALGGAATGWPAAAQAALPEVGFLHPGRSAAGAARLEAVDEGLRSRGFIAGRNVSVVSRFADFDPAKVDAFAAELIGRKVSVLIAVGPQAVFASRKLTTSIPIVAQDLESDPVKSGLVERLSHPGGNVTGMFFDFPEFSTKWLELLREVLPDLKKIGLLWDPRTGTVQLEAVTEAARQRNLALQTLKVDSPAGIDAAFQAAVDAGAQAVLALSSPIFGTIPQQVAAAALGHRMPTITLFPEYADAGGLMAYGTSLTDLFRQVGEMAGKVLAGAKPQDLPVERPSRFELVVNLKTAAALGITVPQVVQLRADRLVE